MKKRNFSLTNGLVSLKDVLSSDSTISVFEVSLDDELVSLGNLSESDLLGDAKSVYEEELHRKVLENEKDINSRLGRLKSYGDGIF